MGMMLDRICYTINLIDYYINNACIYLSLLLLLLIIFLYFYNTITITTFTIITITCDRVGTTGQTSGIINYIKNDYNRTTIVYIISKAYTNYTKYTLYILTLTLTLTLPVNLMIKAKASLKKIF